MRKHEEHRWGRIGMKRPWGVAACVCAGLVLAHSDAALAHHSFAMFDNSRTLTLSATVVTYQWTNPHAYLTLLADDGQGGTKRYTLEMTSINMMHRGGWTSRTVKPGDQVSAIVAPLRDGQPGGLLLELTLPDGKKMSPGVPNEHLFKRTPQ
jgi:hypothetical protein